MVFIAGNVPAHITKTLYGILLIIIVRLLLTPVRSGMRYKLDKTLADSVKKCQAWTIFSPIYDKLNPCMLRYCRTGDN